jgi:hypothetical protein
MSCRFCANYKLPQRIDFKLGVLVFRCLRGLAPAYLVDEFRRMTDIDGRKRLRSASTTDLVVPLVLRSVHGGRSFPVAEHESGTVGRPM